jgi:hypothetical protein
MNDWNHGLVGSKKEPIPVLQVYYQRLGRAISLESLPGDFSQVQQDRALDVVGDQKNLQRIYINSDILHAELELITSTSIVFPIT